MYTTLDIYTAFRKVQAQQKNKGIRLPKDWQHYFNNNLNVSTQDNILNTTNAFNTKWSSIDPHKYFEAGFDILKGFTYKHFFDGRVIDRYIHNDKIAKRYSSFKKGNIVQDILFVMEFIHSDDTANTTLMKYCTHKHTHDAIHDAIHHYIKNKIGTTFLAWIINDKYIIPSELEWSLIPFISENKRLIYSNINENHVWLNKLKGMTHEKIQRKYVDR